MKFIPFESSHRDESNGTNFIFLKSILTEIQPHKHLKKIGNRIWSND